jgi:hypothetical protein
MTVHRLLATGTEEQLQDFHLHICLLLNSIERRRQTVFYTCLDQDYEFAKAAAAKTHVTVQEMQEKDGEEQEEWVIIVQGELPGWKPVMVRQKGKPHGKD